jgi:hypothetical protein
LKTPVAGLLFLFASVCATAQIRLYEGYVVTNEGDTLRGKIEDWGPSSNSQVVSFVKAGQKRPTAYYPPQVRGFFFHGSGYESKKIVTPAGEHREVFLKILVKGKLSLYKYRQVLYLTRDTLAFHVAQGRGDSPQMKRSKGLIKLLVLNCKSIEADSIKTTREDELKKIAIQYNICMGSQYVDYDKIQPRSRAALAVTVGENAASIKVTDDFAAAAPNRPYSYKSASSIVFGLSADFGKEDNPSFYLGATYFSANFQGNVNSSTKYYNGSFIRLSLGSRLKFRGRLTQTQIGFGVSQLITTKMSSLEVYSDGLLYSETVRPVSPANPQGIWLSFGLQRRISGNFAMRVEGRVEQMTGFIKPQPAVIPGSSSPAISGSSMSNSTLLVSLVF